MAGARGGYYLKSFLEGKGSQTTQESDRHFLGKAAQRYFQVD